MQTSVRHVKRLELSVAADADLFDILAYGTAIHGEAASDAYFGGLCDAFETICATEMIGQVDDSTDRGLRRWRYRRHRIFYRIDPDSILIVRVLHVAADAVRHLQD